MAGARSLGGAACATGYASGWHIVPSPRVGVLHGVAAVSANDVWAVGQTTTGQGLAEHWDGRRWRVVSVPHPPNPQAGVSASYLFGVVAVASHDVWAVGQVFHNLPWATLAEHWDGRHWRLVPSPTPLDSGSNLWGVAVVSTHDIWAVGYHFPHGQQQPLVEHWNGRRWRIVPSPNPGLAGTTLLGVAAVARRAVWAVGGAFGSRRGAVVERWDGVR